MRKILPVLMLLVSPAVASNVISDEDSLPTNIKRITVTWLPAAPFRGESAEKYWEKKISEQRLYRVSDKDLWIGSVTQTGQDHIEVYWMPDAPFKNALVKKYWQTKAEKTDTVYKIENKSLYSAKVN